MFNSIFGKHDVKNVPTNGVERNGTDHGGSTERKESFKRLLGPQQVVQDNNNGHKPATASVAVNVGPPSFEQIYQSATVKPPKLAYGIVKVAEMAASPHLAGMPTEFKRKALLMALDAADTSVEDVLNDVVIRQRALKDYEDALQEKVKQFDDEQAERNRLEQQEFDRITSQHMARIQATLDEVARAHEEFRAWQKSKQQESQRLTEAAALCVAHEKVEEDENNNNVMAIPQRATGTFR